MNWVPYFVVLVTVVLSLKVFQELEKSFAGNVKPRTPSVKISEPVNWALRWANSFAVLACDISNIIVAS